MYQDLFYINIGYDELFTKWTTEVTSIIQGQNNFFLNLHQMNEPSYLFCLIIDIEHYHISNINSSKVANFTGCKYILNCQIKKNLNLVFFLELINWTQPVYVRREDPDSRHKTIQEIINRVHSKENWSQVMLME